MRIVWKILILLPLIYVVLLGGLFAVMCHGSEVFTRGMAKKVEVALTVIPFKPVWCRARAGRLKPGDEAPSLSLEALDKKSRVQLSDFRGKQPVVLVLGSYT